jgi:hypothetical protein
MQASKTQKKKLQIRIEEEDLALAGNENLTFDKLYMSNVEKIEALDSLTDINNKMESLATDSDTDVITIIKNFMEGRGKEEDDISYNWILKDNNIQYLNKCIKTDMLNIKSVVERRDTNCELEVRKLIKIYFFNCSILNSLQSVTKIDDRR